MKFRHLTAADFVRQPWKNGGGSTTQLAVEGEGERFLWRLSAADVEQSGPFSDFSGYERTIMLLEGDGMDLEIDGRTVQVHTPFEPVVFDGAAKTRCTLRAGPVRDLNLMVDRARAHGSLQVVHPDHFRGARIDAPYLLVHASQGWTRVAMDGVDVSLAPDEVLRVDDARGAELALLGLERGARVALILIRSSRSR
jgi:environmental stress-induced protein Ves